MEGNSKANKEPTANKPLLSEDFGLRRLGYLLVASLVFLTGGWSITAPIESAAIAPGEIVIDSVIDRGALNITNVVFPLGSYKKF